MSGAVPTDAHGSAIEPLDVIAGKAKEFLSKAKKADNDAENYRISAGQLLIQAKTRIDAGEKDNLGRKIKWSKWSQEHFKRSRQDIHRVMRIAAAPDPAAALAADREETRQRVARTRNPVTYVRDKTEPPALPGRASQESIVPTMPKPASDMPQPGEELDDIKRWIVDDLTDDQKAELLIWLDDLINARKETVAEPPPPPQAALATPPPPPPEPPVDLASATVQAEPTSPAERSAFTSIFDKGWQGTKPPCQCNTKDGKCRYAQCKSTGCCKVPAPMKPPAVTEHGTAQW